MRSLQVYGDGWAVLDTPEPVVRVAVGVGQVSSPSTRV